MRISSIDRARHEGLWPSEEAAKVGVTIVGCGAIGSWAALLLAKMGVRRFTLVDFDKVEGVNVSVQAFGVLAIGDSKVRALADTLVRDVEVREEDIILVEGKWTEEVAKETDVCVASMDNLKGRQEVWGAMRTRCKLFVDPRMGGQWLEMYAIEPKGEDIHLMREYLKVIYPKDESFTQEPCSARAIAYTAAVAGAQVANVVRQWAVKEPERMKMFMFDLVKGSAWTLNPGPAEDRLAPKGMGAEIVEVAVGATVVELPVVEAPKVVELVGP